jgi:hypothetical protein
MQRHQAARGEAIQKIYRGNVHNIFKRTSTDTELLERIGMLLDHDFFQYYIKKSPAPASNLPAENKKTRVFVEVEIDNDLRNKLSS